MLLVFLLLMAPGAYGDKYAYPEQKLSAAGIESIQISGVKGQVKLKGRPGKSFRLKVKHSKSKKYEDWSLAVHRRDKTLHLEVSSIAYGAQWRQTVKRDQWPEFDVELSGPSVPVTVSWREGDLSFNNWSANVESSHIKGKLLVHGGVGNYTLQTGDGDVDMSNLAGDVTLTGNSGKVWLDEVSGKVSVSWVSGKVEMKSVLGGGKVDLNDGDLNVAVCQGDWSMSVARGKAEIERCSGKLTLTGETTAWMLRASHKLETEIKSLSGPVSVAWPKTRAGGAKVFLTSDSGEIGGKDVKAELDAEGRKVAEFKIGSKPFGQVFVRTQSGPINFAR